MEDRAQRARHASMPPDDPPYVAFGDSALSSLFHVAIAPVNLAVSAVESVYGIAATTVEGAGILLHLVPLLLHAF